MPKCWVKDKARLGLTQLLGWVVNSGVKLIPLSQGIFAKVDDEDFWWLSSFTWYVRKAGGGDLWYANRETKIGGLSRKIGMHQLLLFGGHQIDHKNRNGLDNRKRNLRFANPQTNTRNAKKTTWCKATSKYKGVSWEPARNQWTVKLYTGPGKHVMCLGRFHDEIEAAKAYDRAARKYYGEFARPNFMR